MAGSASILHCLMAVDTLQKPDYLRYNINKGKLIFLSRRYFFFIFEANKLKLFKGCQGNIYDG